MTTSPCAAGPVQVLRRKPMDFPRQVDLPADLHRRFDEVLGDLKGRPAVPAVAIAQSPADDFAHLTHALSDHFVSRNAVRFKARSGGEEPVARAIGEDRWIRALSTGDDFLALALEVHLRCCPVPPHGPRKGDIQLNADALGTAVRFCSPMEAARQLRALGGILADPATSTLYGLLAILVAVTNAHYFADGNGRTSRILMNAYARWKMPDLAYIPFSEIFSRSRGGYEIRLRQAEIRSDWLPLAQYLVDCTELVSFMHDAGENAR